MTKNELPKGLALYVRKLDSSDHGTPKQFAKKCRDHKAGWIAIGGPWHDIDSKGRINAPNTVKPYMEALEQNGIQAWIWGYPWAGTEEKFVEQAAELVPDGIPKRIILDDELGANPQKISTGAGKKKAEDHVKLLVEKTSQRFDLCMLSTFGSGVKLKWFPLYAYVRALKQYFPKRSAIGGQTYTDDKAVLPSINDFEQAINKCDAYYDIEICPNFGTYGRKPDGKARSKTVDEFRSHVTQFMHNEVPIERMIGWAENFMNKELWTEFAKFSELMERGAFKL